MRNKNNLKYIKVSILLAVIIIAAGIFASCSQNITTGVLDGDAFQKYVDSQTVIKAKVLKIVSDETEMEKFDELTVTTETIMFTSVILEKDMKGQIISSRQTIDSQSYNVNKIKKGNLIYIFPSIENDKPIGDFIEYSRANQLMWFFILFAVIIIIFSGFKGLRSLVALTLTCLAIFFLFIPALDHGISPRLAAIAVCLLITLLTLAIVYGINRKSISAAIGCMLGVAIAGILAHIMQASMHMSGLSDQHSVTLSYTFGYDMKGIIFAAVVIGALGAVMDVAISIASSLEEIIIHTKEKIAVREVIKSGMKIGADIMGTMTNTLVLAYVGSSLPVIILLFLNSAQFAYAISWEMISEEFLNALAGSIGLIFVVPATSVVTAFLLHKKKSADAAAGDPVPEITQPEEEC